MNTKKFEKDMAVFSFSQHQDVLAYLSQLQLTGWTIEDAKIWIEEQQKKLIEHQKNYDAQPKCPDCQQVLRSFPVNTEPGNQTGDLTDKSVSLCGNPDCMYTIYNK